MFNALRKILFEDENVEFAGYHVTHPIAGKTLFRVKTKKSASAKKALVDGINRLKERISEFRDKFAEAKKTLSA